MAQVILGYQAEPAIIPLYSGADWLVRLMVPRGSDPWPTGTECSVVFFNPDGSEKLRKPGEAHEDYLFFKVESEDCDEIPDKTRFMLYVVLPTVPTTEILRYYGAVKRVV